MATHAWGEGESQAKLPMIPERWQKMEELFQSVRARPVEERAAFLRESCAGDDALRGEVEALLAFDSKEDGGFEEIASGVAATWAAESDRYGLVGQTLGRYKVLAPLGSGGMGEVYLTHDTTLERKTALKLLPRQFTQDTYRLRRFEQEARAASALNHPNIITIYEIGEWNGARFIASEYIEGETLREQMEKPDRRLSDILEIGIQASGALAAAHQAGIVHRDIKPANIMLRTDGYIKVLDFGLAKLMSARAHPDATEAGRVMGTINYMSPEQAMGQPLDHRTDIFSLGVVLYEIATGHRLFEGKSEAATYDCILHQTIPPMREFAPSLPLEFDQVLRRALERDPARRYQSASDLRADLQRLAQGSGPTEAALAASRAHRAAQRPRMARVAALAALVLGAIGAALFWRGQFAARHQAAASPNESSVKSIAVLPFVDLSQAKDQEYMCDGVSEELLDSLSKIEGLHVVARTSSFSFKGKTVGVSEIAEKLGVQNILEGSLRRDGNRIRITAQLINARDGFHLWSETFERELEGVFAVQDEITGAIVEKLRAKLALAPSTRPPENPEAHELYLRGLYFSNKSSEEELRKALALFQQALEKDPNFARAWTGIAKVWLWLADEYVKPLEGYAAMEAAASKALALNPNDAEARCHLGEAKWFLNWDPASAEAEIERALAIDPNSASAHLLLALLQPDRGDCGAGIAHIRAAERLDPLSPVITNRKKSLMIRCRRLDEALAAAQRTVELDPNFLYRESPLAVVYRAQGKLDQALALYLKAAEMRHRPSAGLALAYADLGRKAEAREVLQQLLERRKSRYVRPDAIAGIYAALGEREEAFAWLETAYQEHSSSLPNVAFLSEFGSLLSDPRFADLMRRIGFDPAVILGQQKFP
jgi:TolB-like protein/Tfp pilus assembly protein PilF/predicted Ser/Thr protein kinase